MPVHPLWRPLALPDEEQIRSGRVEPDDSARWQRAIEVVPPDPAWPARFAEVVAAVRGALGERVIAIEHVGSTSVPGLAAKPVIDVALLVADSADESAYVPQLEAAGFVLVVREPEWEEHRCLTWDVVRTNLHVFSTGSVEPQRLVAFREWLRTHPDDLATYAATKTQLALDGFTDVMLYNNAKAGLIYDIYERIFAADPHHPHDPQPRPVR